MQGTIPPNRWEGGRQECHLSFRLGVPGSFTAVPCWYFSWPGYQVPGTKRTVRCESITPVALDEDMTLICSWHPAPRRFTSYWLKWKEYSFSETTAGRGMGLNPHEKELCFGDWRLKASFTVSLLYDPRGMIHLLNTTPVNFFMNSDMEENITYCSSFSFHHWALQISWNKRLLLIEFIFLFHKLDYQTRQKKNQVYFCFHF